MAIEGGLIKEDGPFVGTSCLPWRQRGEGVRSPLAVNVDFSRGTIRARNGAAPFYYPSTLASKFRVLGMSGYRKRNGESLLVYIALTTLVDSNTVYPWKLELRIHDVKGTLRKTVRIDEDPYFEVPDPDNWYTMAQYNDNLFIASERGRVLRYNFETDPDAPEYAKGLAVYTGMPHITTYPQGSIVIEHESQMVVAGFDGATSHNLSTPLPAKQTTVPENLLTDELRSSVTFLQTGVMIGDAPFSDVFIPDRYVDFPAGGKVTGLASTSAGLLVLTENSAHIVQISKSDMDAGIGSGAMSQTLSKATGCVHQRSVAQGRGLTAWMGSDGIYMYDGNHHRYTPLATR